VFGDTPRYALAKGGEGGGKSVAGIVKTLERVRRGMYGAMVSPDLPHFKRSLWPEFRRWCPWHMVVPEHQYRKNAAWEPREPFSLVFEGGGTLLCGGIEDPSSWEGPNLHFVHFDEARRKKTADALKVLDGRVRLVGPLGELPQLYITTTPRKHWLHEYFGPLDDVDDPFASFKRDSLVINLLTKDNAAYLAPGFVEQRRQSLTEAEARVLLDAEWEDIDDIERFLPSITWWDACREVLPPLDARTPLVLAADAGVSNDSFGLVGVSRHPQDDTRIAVRTVRVWVPKKGVPLDFDVIEKEITALCERYHVVQLAYDAYQLHQMMTRLQNNGVVWTKVFPQGDDRLIADKDLLDVITQKRIAHDGNAELRQHVDNADRKVDAETRKIRIVKRSQSAKVDLAVALSMAAYRCLKLNLG